MWKYHLLFVSMCPAITFSSKRAAFCFSTFVINWLYFSSDSDFWLCSIYKKVIKYYPCRDSKCTVPCPRPSLSIFCVAEYQILHSSKSVIILVLQYFDIFYCHKHTLLVLLRCVSQSSRNQYPNCGGEM